MQHLVIVTTFPVYGQLVDANGILNGRPHGRVARRQRIYDRRMIRDGFSPKSTSTTRRGGRRMLRCGQAPSHPVVFHIAGCEKARTLSHETFNGIVEGTTRHGPLTRCPAGMAGWSIHPTGAAKCVSTGNQCGGVHDYFQTTGTSEFFVCRIRHRLERDSGSRGWQWINKCDFGDVRCLVTPPFARRSLRTSRCVGQR
jgi:hypothetical protein